MRSRQYWSTNWCRIHSDTNGSCDCSRSSHIPRQRSPTSSGSGGSIMVCFHIVPQTTFSLITQPPSVCTSSV